VITFFAALPINDVPITANISARQSAGSFRPDIEGLRGVAVLLVVGCHCGLVWCPGGFVGVDVFFVLSGYLITGLLAAEYRATSRIDLPAFFARRARRLLPSGALLLVVVMLVAAAIFSPAEIAFTGQAARAAGLYMSNVFFDRTASDYFAPQVAGNPLLHTWSLGLEEQFYLVWPWLILMASRGASGARRSIGALGTVVVVSFLFCLYATRHAPTVAFYELPARAWEFAAGGLLAVVPASRAAAVSRWAVGCGIVGVGMILGTAALVKGGAGFPGWIAVFPVTGTLAMLFAGAAAPQRGMSVALSAAPLQFLGARSYSWYLWHWPFIVFAGILFPDITVTGRVGAAVAALWIATATYRCVERPVRKNRYLIDRSALSLGFAAGATVLVLVASWSLLAFGRDQVEQDRRLLLITAGSHAMGDLPESCYGAGSSSDVKVCEFGAAGALPALVLFGDSHAMQWFDPMRTAAKLEGWRLITVLRSGCAASDINPQRESVAAGHCKQWRARAIKQIIAMHPAAIVMASFNGGILRDDYSTGALLSADEIRLGTRLTLQELSRAGAPIVVLRDTPLPPFNIPYCVARRLGRPHSGGSCNFDAAVALNETAFSAEQAAAGGLTDIHFLDMDDLICPGKYCPATRNGVPIYRDSSHMTATFTETLAPVLRVRLFPLLRIARVGKELSGTELIQPGLGQGLAAILEE
jgi:peptidoglycan/LPS O-acetylase OafA/YrhL